MAARRAAALLASRFMRPASVTAPSAYNPAPLAAALAARSYRYVACTCHRCDHPPGGDAFASVSTATVSHRTLCIISACCKLRWVAAAAFLMALVSCCRSALPLPADPSEHIAPAYSNAAAVLHGINDLRYEEAPSLPQTVAPGAVRVAIKAVGICRSDVHYLQKVGCSCLGWSARRQLLHLLCVYRGGGAACACCLCPSLFEGWQLMVRLACRATSAALL